MSRFVRLLILVVALLGLAPTTTASAANFTYDAQTVARVDAHAFGVADASRAQLSGALEESASPVADARGTSTTPAVPFLATNTVNGVSIKGLMGSAGDVVVLGRQVDTAVAKDWAGYVVLDTPKWNLAVNDAFISETIAQGRSVYLATPLEGNLVQTAGQYAGQPTIYARELEQLLNAGYRRVGDYMVPPGG